MKSEKSIKRIDLEVRAAARPPARLALSVRAQACCVWNRAKHLLPLRHGDFSFVPDLSEKTAAFPLH